MMKRMKKARKRATVLKKTKIWRGNLKMRNAGATNKNKREEQKRRAKAKE